MRFSRRRYINVAGDFNQQEFSSPILRKGDVRPTTTSHFFRLPSGSRFSPTEDVYLYGFSFRLPAYRWAVSSSGVFPHKLSMSPCCDGWSGNRRVDLRSRTETVNTRDDREKVGVAVGLDSGCPVRSFELIFERDSLVVATLAANSRNSPTKGTVVSLSSLAMMSRLPPVRRDTFTSCPNEQYPPPVAHVSTF